jgi:hypothetical protein
MMLLSNHEALEQAQMSAETSTIRLTLADHMAVRAFYVRKHLLRNSLIFFVLLFAGILLVGTLGGLPMRLTLLVLAHYWKFYLSVTLAAFLLVRALPFLWVTVTWLNRKFPSEMTVSVDDDGIRYSIFNTDTLIHWPAITAISVTPNAYYITSKSRILRLRKDGLTEAQRRALDKAKTVAGRQAARVKF